MCCGRWQVRKEILYKFQVSAGIPKTFQSWYQWRKLHLWRKLNKAGRPMEGEADVNEDFSYFTNKSESSAFFKSSVTLTPRFVVQVYQFMAVILRVRQVTLSTTTESYSKILNASDYSVSRLNLLVLFYVYWTVHHCDSRRIKDNLMSIAILFHF